MYRDDHEFGSVYEVTPKLTSKIGFENRAKRSRWRAGDESFDEFFVGKIQHFSRSNNQLL